MRILVVEDNKEVARQITKALEREFELVRTTLQSMDQPHLNEFLTAWTTD